MITIPREKTWTTPSPSASPFPRSSSWCVRDISQSPPRCANTKTPAARSQPQAQFCLHAYAGEEKRPLVGKSLPDRDAGGLTHAKHNKIYNKTNPLPGGRGGGGDTTFADGGALSPHHDV